MCTQMIGSQMTDIATERSTKWLSGADLRPTRQRMTLAKLLVGDGKNRHVTAESLYASASGCDENVINGFSELFSEVFGEEHGIGVRSAVGMHLPQNIPVEIEAAFLLET